MARITSVGFSELHTQLKITNRLLAAGLRDRMRQNELIGLLETTGATNQEIADVLDTTPPIVAVTLHRLRKKAAKR